MIRRGALALAIGLFCLPIVAWAHAFLERASPAVGSTVRSAPTAISLSFSEAVEPVICTIALVRSDGAAIALGRPATTNSGATLIAPIRGAMPPGAYVVRWRVVSVDTHVTQGDFSFRIAP